MAPHTLGRGEGAATAIARRGAQDRGARGGPRRRSHPTTYGSTALLTFVD
jgi:hypothetical protein